MIEDLLKLTGSRYALARCEVCLASYVYHRSLRRFPVEGRTDRLPAWCECFFLDSLTIEFLVWSRLKFRYMPITNCQMWGARSCPNSTKPRQMVIASSSFVLIRPEQNLLEARLRIEVPFPLFLNDGDWKWPLFVADGFFGSTTTSVFSSASAAK